MGPLTSKSTSAASAVLASMGLLCACTTGPSFVRPEAPKAQGYAMSGDPASSRPANLAPEVRAAGPWWTALGSLELDRLIRTALAESPDIAIAEANVRAALAEADAAHGSQSPRIDARAGVQRERINTQAFGFQGFPSPTINLYELGASVSYDFDIFGRRRRADEAATARSEFERRRADAAYLTLSANIALQAIRIATLRASIDAATATVNEDRRILDLIARAQAAGGAPRSQTSVGEAQLAQDLAQLPPLERQLAEARHQLALLVGRAPGEWSAPQFTLSDFTLPAKTPVAIPSALVRSRPDILAAEAQAHAATAELGVANANLYPNLTLNANFTLGSIAPENLFEYNSSGWSLGGGLTAPIFHGGELKARKKVAVARAEAALADYRRTVLRAFVQVSDSLSGLGSDEQATAAQARAEAAARANLEDSRRAYELGAGPLLNVFDAQRQVNLATRQNVEVRGRVLQDVVQLFAATAADWR